MIFNLLMVLSGWFVADLITGIAHLLLDYSSRYPSLKKIWILGKVIKDFEVHHTDPDLTLKFGFWETSWKTILIVGILGVALSFILPLSFVVTLFLGLISAQEFHKCAHRKENSFIIKLLQGTLILSKSEHSLHHIEPHNKNFAVLNGWSNTLINLAVSKWMRI